MTQDAILYVSRTGDKATVVRIDRATDARATLAQLPVVGSTWAVAPNGQTLLYTRIRDVQSDLYRLQGPIDRR